MSEHQTFRTAKVVKDFGGRFSKFKVGERVLARNVNGVGYVVERLKWKHPKLELFNQCVGVPGKSLNFIR